jgi:hypothetical protein
LSEMSEKEAFPYTSIRHFLKICNPLGLHPFYHQS